MSWNKNKEELETRRKGLCCNVPVCCCCFWCNISLNFRIIEIYDAWNSRYSLIDGSNDDHGAVQNSTTYIFYLIKWDFSGPLFV